MSTVEVTDENLASLIESKGTLIIDFWAEWCGPCRSFAPIFEAASERHPDVVFGKCDTEAQQKVAGMFQVRSIPMVVVFRDGVGIFQQSGDLPGPALDELLGQVAELNMDEVHAQVAAQQAGATEETGTESGCKSDSGCC